MDRLRLTSSNPFGMLNHRSIDRSCRDTHANSDNDTESTADATATTDVNDDNLIYLVDHALRDALARPKHRNSGTLTPIPLQSCQRY